jgi:hypothetical protein
MKKIVLGLILFAVLSFHANGQEIDLKYEKYKKNALTFGLLNGGGLIGAELETLLKGRLGAHLGFGFVGACAGLDFHLKPTTTSSAFVLELRVQGVSEIYTGTMVGLGYLIRYKGISLQLGGSYLLDEGPNTIENWNTRPFVPQVSLGFFNAF